MPFVITCRAWKALFKAKEKNLLNWKERERKKK
jgi:hypothetical protein